MDPSSSSQDTPAGLSQLANRGFADFRHLIVEDASVSLQSISQVIYPKFTVHGGTAKITGCTTEYKPILKFELRRDELPETMFWSDSEVIEPDFAESLRLGEAVELSPAEILKRTVEGVISFDQSRDALASFLNAKTDNWEISNLEVIWCKSVEGKLSFQFPKAETIMSFFGWGRHLIDGLAKCPPYYCDLVDQSCYEIGTDDDEDICCFGRMVNCEITGRWLADTKTATCCVSGKTISLEHLWECPESGGLLLESLHQTCRICQQNLNPAQLKNGACIVCRSLERISRDNEWVQLVIANHPNFARWTRWKVSLGKSFVVVYAGRLFRKHLTVVERESRRLITERSGSLFSRQWTDVDNSHQNSL